MDKVRRIAYDNIEKVFSNEVLLYRQQSHSIKSSSDIFKFFKFKSFYNNKIMYLLNGKDVYVSFKTASTILEDGNTEFEQIHNVDSKDPLLESVDSLSKYNHNWIKKSIPQVISRLLNISNIFIKDFDVFTNNVIGFNSFEFPDKLTYKQILESSIKNDKDIGLLAHNFIYGTTKTRPLEILGFNETKSVDIIDPNKKLYSHYKRSWDNAYVLAYDSIPHHSDNSVGTPSFFILKCRDPMVVIRIRDEKNVL